MNAKKSPQKPYPEFPLYPHGRGQWAKKIRGKTHYFGRIADGWEAALETYEKEVHDLRLGRTPRRTEAIEGLTFARLCNKYLAAAETRAKAGEIGLDSWDDSKRTAKIALQVIGRSVPVDSLRPTDFERLRSYLIDHYALSTVTGHVARMKAILKWAYDTELVEQPVRVGPHFRKPEASQLRREQAKRPEKLFSAAEVRWLIDNAPHPLNAMVLLGINCGLGNRDCGELEFRHLDLDGGWLTYPRPKTGIHRRAKLWPETVAAIKEAIAKRREPLAEDEKLANRVFLTRKRQPWAKEGSRDSPVAKAFSSLQKKGKMALTGRGFYSLRHTFRTIADESEDQPAIDYIMGHVDPSMAGVYRKRISDARLEKVASYVDRWLAQPAKGIKSSA